MELNDSFFDFKGFTQPDVNKKPEPKKRKSRAKPKVNTGNAEVNAINKMYTYGKRNVLVDYKLPFLSDVLRQHFLDYYKQAINSNYAHKYNESIRIAEAIIYNFLHNDTNEEQALNVDAVLMYANHVRQTMSHKGWNLTFRGTTSVAHDVNINILCIFQPNYRSKYTIIAHYNDTRIVIFNDIIECEKTILSTLNDVPQI